jgi:hypothetical protein
MGREECADPTWLGQRDAIHSLDFLRDFVRLSSAYVENARCRGYYCAILF